MLKTTRYLFIWHCAIKNQEGGRPTRLVVWPVTLMNEQEQEKIFENIPCHVIKYVTTLTLGSWLNVECKGQWGQESVFRCETHFYKWGRVQRMEPNDFHMHSHFGNYIHVIVANVESLGWKRKQVANWAPRTPLERSWSVHA